MAYPVYDFMTALKFVSHAMGVRDVRPYLNGVHVSITEHRTTLTATDGHRAARIVLDVPGEFSEFIITAGCVKQLLAAIKTKLADCRQLTLSSKELCVEHGATFPLQLEDGRFPDVDRILPKTEPTGAPRIGMRAKYVAQACTALSLVASPKYGEIAINTWDANTIMQLTTPTNHGAFAAVSEPALAIIMPMRL